MSPLIKALPYLVSIGGALIGAVKWLYGALQKERDRYSKDADHKEKVIVDKDKKIADLSLEVADLKAKVHQQQWLIDQYVKKFPKEDLNDEAKH